MRSILPRVGVSPGRRSLTAALLAVVVAAGLAACSGTDAKNTPSSSVNLDASLVSVADGSLRGSSADGYRSFLGVPYAAPPVGALRWKPPAPAVKWSGQRDATKAGAACPQGASIVSGGDSGSGSTIEDCLFLNVYTPTAGTARRTLTEAAGKGKLPVMVWVHGGSYINGAGSDYGPGRLVADSGVIVVTINYRLGALGFMDLPQLESETSLGSGAYGLLDQQAALRWVQRNISRFGGDAKNVTLFGESAGAGSVCSQLVSPQAKGLFAKAIAESGCALRGPTKATAEKTGIALAAQLGCKGATIVACMRSKPAATIRSTQNSSGTTLSWAPASGGPVLPTTVEAAFASGNYRTVPLLQGTNHDEGRLFALSLGLNNLGADLYSYAVNRSAPSVAAKILAEYPLAKYNNKPGDALGAIITDNTFSCPALRVDQSASKRTTVYGYEFNDPKAPLPLVASYPLKAAHAAELPYLFDLKKLGALPSAAQKLSQQMIGYWTNFAINGDPNGSGNPPWAKFTGSSGTLQALLPAGSETLASASFAADHHCGFWNTIPNLSLRS
jgi:para-nitrobenzyl esterase